MTDHLGLEGSLTKTNLMLDDFEVSTNEALSELGSRFAVQVQGHVFLSHRAYFDLSFSE